MPLINAIKEHFAEIARRDDEILRMRKEWGVGTWLHTALFVLGAWLFAISQLMIFMGIIAIFMGNVSVDPPSTLDPIHEAGYGFLLNRWFWRALLPTGIIFTYLAFRWHPESMVERQIAKKAVENYKRCTAWPWRD